MSANQKVCVSRAINGPELLARIRSGETLPSDTFISRNDPGRPGIDSARTVECVGARIYELYRCLYRAEGVFREGNRIRGIFCLMLFQVAIYAHLGVLALLRKPCSRHYPGIHRKISLMIRECREEFLGPFERLWKR